MKYFLKEIDGVHEVEITDYYKSTDEYKVLWYDSIEESWVGEIVSRDRLLMEEELPNYKK